MMELAKLTKDQKQSAERFLNMLSQVVTQAWPERARTLTLVNTPLQWSDGRWAMAYWQAPEKRCMAIAVPEEGIEKLVDEVVPGFEQAAPMLKWEEPFLQISEEFWQTRVPWELADLEVSDDPEGWLAKHELIASLVVFAMPIALTEEQESSVYFVIPSSELATVPGEAKIEQKKEKAPTSEEKRSETDRLTFTPLEPSVGNEQPGNIELILDVPLTLTVELGRTVRAIREVLEMGPGSLVELDRMAGESVDVLVNNKLVAKGEVVVIDENFGVRITDIISPKERLQRLG